MRMVLYIIEDHGKTKIGITKNLEKRKKAYRLHNPSFKVYNTFKLEKDEAEVIEKYVKVKFKSKCLEGGSSEWFNVSPKVVNDFCISLTGTLGDYSDSSCDPNMAAIDINPDSVYDQLKDIKNELKKKHIDYGKIHDLQDICAKQFGETFALGFLDPSNQMDIIGSETLQRFEKMEICDHVVVYYKSLEVNDCISVSYPSAIVMMPYPGSYKIVEDVKKWHYSRHDKWSWWWCIRNQCKFDKPIRISSILYDADILMNKVPKVPVEYDDILETFLWGSKFAS
jgi:hypothetical protein